MVLLSPTVTHPPSASPIQQRMAPELSRICNFGALGARNGRQGSKLSPSPLSDQNSQELATPTTDSTLTALAQLGLYRYDCSHAFITVIDNNESHVVAEATSRSCSTNDKLKEGAGCLLGVTSLDAELTRGSLFDRSNVTNNEGSHIVRDIGLEDQLKDHPFVIRCPDARFYAEVPLRKASGEIFGTYGIVDGHPCPSFKYSNLRDLYDVAEPVEKYLENVWMENNNHRAERQLNALLTFVKGQSDFHAKGATARKRSSVSSQFSSRATTLHHNGHGLPSQAEKSEPSPFYTRSEFQSNPNISPFFGNQDNDAALSPHEVHQQHVRKCSEESNNLVLVTETASIPHRTSWLFSRASSLLQECMDLDGVVFVDASRSNSRSSSCGSASDWELSSQDNDSCGSRHSSGFSSHSWSERLCEPLGAATSDTSPTKDKLSHMMTEGLLHDMFAAFPHGEIFNSLQHSHSSNEHDRHTHQMISIRLRHCFPDARSMLFFPLWSWDKSRWLAATLIWTCRDQRSFKTEDLHYLRAFSDSIVSEFSQLDWSATDKAKSDLLSSVSHELRSPLHGMLASTELLQTTSLEPTQRDMVSMVETCGLTLLDTMNYLLDFAKINNLTRVHKRGEYHETDIDNLSSEFDLGSLVEDVTDALYSGHRLLVNSSKIAGRYLPVGAGVSGRSPAAEAQDQNDFGNLAVVVRIEAQDSWKIQSISGGWRRIIMNLLGNAFKFTQSGFIEVSLAQKTERMANSKSTFAHLTITDTGRGISPSFLKHKLFTPFSQESYLTEGVGLGLSIVQQLVTYLGGYLDVKSEVHIGTQVDVFIPVEILANETHDHKLDKNDHPGTRIMTRVCLVGLNAYANLKEAPQGLLSVDAKRKLSIRSAVSNILLSQPGWMLSCADSLDQARGEIAVLEESTLKKIAEKGSIKVAFRSIIVLGEHGISLPEDFSIEGPEIIYIPQPLGPRKIVQALQKLTELEPSIGDGDESPIFGPISGVPMRGRSLSDAFAMAKGIESPPVVKENVSEFSPPSPKGHPHQNIHVLIVDDNDINLKILSTFMRKIGCSYETASNGLIAVEKYKSSDHRFDYVLMDISMPIMDGIVASSRIREYEEHHSLPRSAIMAVTGVASSEMQQQAFAAGIDDYLVKPLSLHDLKRIMSITQ